MKNTVILFRSPSYMDEGHKIVLVPLSLISLASLIKPYKPIILDGNFHSKETSFRNIEDCLDKVLCVGISALTGPEMASGLKFSSMIKEKKLKIAYYLGWMACLLSSTRINTKSLC